MRLLCYSFALSCGAILVSLSGCESRRDRAVLEWVDAWPPIRTGFGTPPDELAKANSFNGDVWLQQGRALPDAEETICRLLRSHDERLNRRKAVHGALYFIGTSRSVPVLIKCLDDDWLRNLAIQDLGHIGIANDDVFRALVRCLHNEGGGTSVTAAWTLATLFGKDAIEAIKQRQQELDLEAENIAKIMEDLESGREIRGNVPRAETKKADDGTKKADDGK